MTTTKAPEYVPWRQMNQRCHDPNHHAFARYGGRGITVHPEWRKSFTAFLAAVGPRPAGRCGKRAAFSLERVDNSKGYEPGNVVWATARQQQRNTDSNNRLTFQGRTACLSEWAEITGISRSTLETRFRFGWSIERAFTVPPRSEPSRIRAGHNRYLTLYGRTAHVAEWARITGMPAHVIRCRLQRGWPIEQALTRPPRGAARRTA